MENTNQTATATTITTATTTTTTATIVTAPKPKTKIENKIFAELVVDKSLDLKGHYENSITIMDMFTKTKTFGKMEASSDNELLINTKDIHGLLAAVRIAHSDHVPICLSPDHFWTLIIQGFGEHMKIYHEKLKSKFVNFDGKKKLEVEANGFKKGSAENAWPSVFPTFSKKIQDNIGEKNHKVLTPSFSTTTPTSKIVHELSMMHAMKEYFDYSCRTSCGISKVKLLGTLEDWKKLKNATINLNQYELEWWTSGLTEIFDKIILTYEGKHDNKFWKYIYKYFGSAGSGTTPTVTGWIMNFFPYINGKQNELASRTLKEAISEIDQYKRRTFQAPPGVESSTVGMLNGSNVTPFLWNYDGAKFNMNFISGFSGATMTKDGYIMPVLSWGVAEKSKK